LSCQHFKAFFVLIIDKCWHNIFNKYPTILSIVIALLSTRLSNLFALSHYQHKYVIIATSGERSCTRLIKKNYHKRYSEWTGNKIEEIGGNKIYTIAILIKKVRNFVMYKGYLQNTRTVTILNRCVSLLNVT